MRLEMKRRTVVVLAGRCGSPLVAQAPHKGKRIARRLVVVIIVVASAATAVAVAVAAATVGGRLLGRKRRKDG